MRTVLRPDETLIVDVLSEDHSGVHLTIRFTDANGLDWKRTSNNSPRRLFERQYRNSRGLLSVLRKKGIERQYR
jgi:hypothetical protein